MRISDWSSDVCSSDLSCVPTALRSIFLGGHVGPNTGICPSGEGTGEQKWVAGGPPSLVTALGDTSRMRSSLLGHQATIQNMSVFVLCLDAIDRHVGDKPVFRRTLAGDRKSTRLNSSH